MNNGCLRVLGPWGFFFFFFFALLPLGFKALVLDKLFATNLLFCSCDNISLTIYNIPGSAN